MKNKYFFKILIIIVLLLVFINIGCQKKAYNINFEPNGGTMVANNLVNGFIDYYETPIKDGFIFAGWFIDKDLLLPFDFNSPIKNDLILYAKWERTLDNEIAIISFETYGGTKFPNLEVQKATLLTKEFYPERINYDFDGWFLDYELLIPFDYNFPIKNDLTLYAKWKPVQYYITFLNKDGSTYKKIKVNAGSSIRGEQPLYTEDDIFVEWSDPLINIQKDMTVFPLYFHDDPKYALSHAYNYSYIDVNNIKNKHFLDLEFPIGLGLPKLNDEEINALIGQPLEVLKAKISTLVDLYSYLIAVKINKNYNPETPYPTRPYYSEEYEEIFHICESASIALGLNRASMGGLANIVKYILDDDYDEIGFYFNNRENGNFFIFNYIYHNGLYYVIDMTQLNNIVYSGVKYFNLSYFPIIHENLEDYIWFYNDFLNKYQPDTSKISNFGIFYKNTPYIPDSKAIFDLENAYFVIKDEWIKNAIQGELVFKTERELFEALYLKESYLIFPEIIDLDKTYN